MVFLRRALLILAFSCLAAAAILFVHLTGAEERARAAARHEADAVAGRAAAAIGFPVAMKIVSPDILHKTEAGGVVLNVRSAAEAEQAYEKIAAGARAYKADARIAGVEIQQMLFGGQEVIVGATADLSFGKVRAYWREKRPLLKRGVNEQCNDKHRFEWRITDHATIRRYSRPLL